LGKKVMAGNDQVAVIESNAMIVCKGSVAISGDWPLSGIGIQ